MNSIISQEKECFVCHSQRFLEVHHVLFGSANRKLSDRFGLTVFLCPSCHRGSAGVHHNRDLDLKLKKIAQERFMEEYGANKEDFIRTFGKSYL